MIRFAARQMALCVTLPVLVACQATTGSGEQTVEGELIEESGVHIPPGAIQTGDDYYMVPIGEDADDCVQYKPWSRSLMVPAAIYYRKADGSFTLNYLDADCGTGT